MTLPNCGIRTQQLAALDRGPRRELAGLGNAEERVRHRLDV